MGSLSLSNLFKTYHWFVVSVLLFSALLVAYFISSTSDTQLSVNSSGVINPLSLKSSLLESGDFVVLESNGRVVESNEKSFSVVTPHDLVIEDGYVMDDNGYVVFDQ